MVQSDYKQKSSCLGTLNSRNKSTRFERCNKICRYKNAVLYSGASFQYEVKERLAYNSKVTVLNEVVNSLNQTWVQIKSSTGRTGWTPKYELISSKMTCNMYML